MELINKFFLPIKHRVTEFLNPYFTADWWVVDYCKEELVRTLDNISSICLFLEKLKLKFLQTNFLDSIVSLDFLYNLVIHILLPFVIIIWLYKKSHIFPKKSIRSFLVLCLFLFFILILVIGALVVDLNTLWDINISILNKTPYLLPTSVTKSTFLFYCCHPILAFVSLAFYFCVLVINYYMIILLFLVLFLGGKKGVGYWSGVLFFLLVAQHFDGLYEWSRVVMYTIQLKLPFIAAKFSAPLLYTDASIYKTIESISYYYIFVYFAFIKVLILIGLALLSYCLFCYLKTKVGLPVVAHTGMTSAGKQDPKLKAMIKISLKT